MLLFVSTLFYKKASFLSAQHRHNHTNTIKPQHITTSTNNIATTSQAMPLLFHRQMHLNNIHDKISPFKKKSSWTLPPFDNPTLTNFFTRSEQDLISVTIRGRKTYSNLTLQEKWTFHNLKNNQSTVIKPCDKGGGICIMNTKDYFTKIHTYLQDRTTYKPLTYNPTSAIVNDTCTLIEYIHSQHIID